MHCVTHIWLDRRVRPVVVRSHLAVLVVGGDFLLLEELVETGFGVFQGPVAVQVGIQVHFLRLQSLLTGSEVSGWSHDMRTAGGGACGTRTAWASCSSLLA